jgi:hypothetical protein
VLRASVSRLRQSQSLLPNFRFITHRARVPEKSVDVLPIGVISKWLEGHSHVIPVLSCRELESSNWS